MPEAMRDTAEIPSHLAKALKTAMHAQDSINKIKAKVDESIEDHRVKQEMALIQLAETLMTTEGVIVVPIDGIEAHTIVVSRDLFDVCKSVMTRVYERKADEMMQSAYDRLPPHMSVYPNSRFFSIKNM